MKKCLAILLTVAMIVPMLTVFFSLGAAAEVAYGTVDTSNDEAGLTVHVDEYGYAEDNYRATTKLDEVPLTYQAWVYIPSTLDAASDMGVVIGNNAGLGNYYNASVSLEIAANYTPKFIYTTEACGNWTGSFTNAVLPVDAWTMLTVVYDSSCAQMRCYINGSLKDARNFRQSSNNVGYMPPLDAHAIGYPFSIAGDLRVMNAHYFKGGLQDTALYSTVRTAAQISADYAAYTQGGGVSLSDSELICYYDVDAASTKKDVADASGNGYSLQYAKTWLTEDEMDAVRANYAFTPAYSFAAISDIQKTTYKEAITDQISPTDTTAFQKSLLYRQYKQLVDWQTEYNLQLVMGMGDITDQDLPAEWVYAKAAIDQLGQAGIPYTLIRGNHDVYQSNDTNGHNIDKYFGVDTSATTDYVDQFTGENGGRYSTTSVRNTYRRLTIGSTNWLILALDYRADDDVLQWARDLCYTHSDHKVIITTHVYLNAEASL